MHSDDSNEHAKRQKLDDASDRCVNQYSGLHLVVRLSPCSAFAAVKPAAFCAAQVT
jgi:hypothetical protein